MLRYLGLKASGEHHRGFGEGHLNVNAFIQRHARHEHLTVNDWKAFWSQMKMITTIIMIMIMTTTVIIDTTESETTGSINQIWEEVGKEEDQFQVKVQIMGGIMKIGPKIYTAKLRDNNQDNSGSFAIDENRPYLQFKQLQQHQSTCQISEQFKKKPFAQHTTFLPTLMKKVVFLEQTQNQLTRREIHQQRTFEQPNNDSQHKIIKSNITNKQQIDVINLEQKTHQDKQNIPMNEQGDTNNGNQQPTQTGATRTPQTEAPDNPQHQQVGQNDDLNNMADQNLFQPTQNFPGLLNLTHQTALSETGSLNQQQQQLSLSLSPSSSSSITQINQNQQPSQRQSLFVTDPNHQFIRGIQQSKYIPIEEAVNRLPLLSEDPK
ncbi:MAG: hypothetical protein EZS28_043770 [Streblomastix strix]|uniref:Uncharacterized protein n=1 Tax=Streblomastix strix TaxID=222440 RepID=A0A5J4TS20_9EUKA|nr:MAG: hypothetical protein EZS28_043770 [Streblomastix strix]